MDSSASGTSKESLGVVGVQAQGPSRVISKIVAMSTAETVAVSQVIHINPPHPAAAAGWGRNMMQQAQGVGVQPAHRSASTGKKAMLRARYGRVCFLYLALAA